MTAIEGHQFILRGESGRALGFAMVCSALGGLIASAALFTIAPFLASIALKFGPTEYFALAVLGLSCISAMTAKDFSKGIFAALIGLFLATVEIDEITGGKRFDFGISTLLSGIPFVPAIIGLFAASEVYRRIAAGDIAWRGEEGGGRAQLTLPKLVEFIQLRWTILRSSVLGFPRRRESRSAITRDQALSGKTGAIRARPSRPRVEFLRGRGCALAWRATKRACCPVPE